jgi:hypothetical protein
MITVKFLSLNEEVLSITLRHDLALGKVKEDLKQCLALSPKEVFYYFYWFLLTFEQRLAIPVVFPNFSL